MTYLPRERLAHDFDPNTCLLRITFWKFIFCVLKAVVHGFHFSPRKQTLSSRAENTKIGAPPTKKERSPSWQWLHGFGAPDFRNPLAKQGILKLHHVDPQKKTNIFAENCFLLEDEYVLLGRSHFMFFLSQVVSRRI